MDAYISSVWAFAFNFAPKGWQQCNGQIMSIQSYQALFSLLGTTFGGNGTTTFGLPDLRGRVPIGSGQGPGLSGYQLGQLGGTENVTLLTGNMPFHTHAASPLQIPVSASQDNQNGPGGNYFGRADDSIANLYASSAGNPMAANNGNSAVTGSSTPVALKNPYIALNYCICITGLYPSRN